MALSDLAREADGKADADHRSAVQVWRRAGSFRTPKWYLITVCVLALVSFLGFFYWIATLVAYPYELDYGEGVVLWQAEHVTHLAQAYHPLTRYPYMVFHYPPLYHLVSLAVSKFTRDLLFAGRLVSMLSSIGICLVLAWVVYRSIPRRASRRAAICGAICTAALPCGLDAMQWSPFMRVDMLGLFLTFGGVATFILARHTAQRYAAFVFLVAAMYTRQTLVAGALACLLIMAVMNLRQAVKMAAFTAVLGGAVLAALFIATHGEVIKHLFVYNVNRYSARDAVGAINATFFSIVPLLAMAGAAVFRSVLDAATAWSRSARSRLRARLSTSTYRLAACTFTVHFVLALLVSMTAGKRGSNVNYFLEWNLSACALAGLFLGSLLSSQTRRRPSAIAALAYVLPLLVLAQGSEAPFSLLLHSDTDRKTLAEEARDFDVLVQILRNSPEPVMSEDMTLLYKAGKQVPFEPAIAAELTATHRWDETPVLNMVRSRAFSVMLIEDLKGRYSPAMAQAIKDNYQPGEQYGDITVYRPGDRLRPMSSAD